MREQGQEIEYGVRGLLKGLIGFQINLCSCVIEKGSKKEK